MAITPQQAAAELLKRKLAIDDFNEFCKYVYPNYIDGDHLITLRSKVINILNGKIKRCMISCPPRHSKSVHCSILLPAYILGKNPASKIVVASYSQDLASDQLLEFKRIIESQKYKNIFPHVELIKDTLTEIKTKEGGGIYSVGIGGSLTGRGADYLIIDDFLKGRDKADSASERKKIKDWYSSTARTRLSPNAPILIIATRWHVHDLIGDLLENATTEWDALNLPAINDEGNALWEEKFDINELNAIKNEMDNIYDWSALYQGSPYIKGGNRFKVDDVKLHTIEEFPDIEYIRCWDLASTKKQRSGHDPDYTVGILGGIQIIDGKKHMWIKDMIRIREEAPKRNEIIKRTAITDGSKITTYCECFAAYKDVFKEMEEILRGIRTVKGSRLSGDKSVKAAPLEPIFFAGNVHLIINSWNEKFLREFEEFPSSNHDDIVDACSILIGEQTKSRSGIVLLP